MTDVHVVVPDSVDDPARPSGGNAYDRRICAGLVANGWSVYEHPVAGAWPTPSLDARQAVVGVLAGLADGAVVLLDGIVACGIPQVSASAGRLTVLVIMHMLVTDGCDGARRAVEGAVLSAAAGVVTTSTWTKARLIERYALQPGRIHVIEPGVDAAALAPGTVDGGELLCVAAVTPVKGHDLLVHALAEVEGLPWRCVFVGALDLDPRFVSELQRVCHEGGTAGRIRFAGTRTGQDLEAAYAAADVLILCSRSETYGMVVTEALSRGIPVIATDVGGIPEALGCGAGREAPGILVPPDDPAALAAALRDWLGDSRLRRRLRQASRERRETLSTWAAAAGRLCDVLARLSA